MFPMNVVRWLLVSSEDATKYSTTVKMALLGLIPYIMQGVGITCGLNLICPAVDTNQLTQIAMSISNIVFLGLSLIAALGTIFGLARKVTKTVDGTNAAFPSPQG